jgi:8-amino-7-oxononanoate synthase
MHDTFTANKIPNRTAECDGKEYLFFSGTSYLGMNSCDEFIAYLEEGMKNYGTNYSSSRNSNFRLQVYEEAEQHLADYTGAEAALTVSSGYMAGQLTVRALEGAGDFIYAPNAHPALWTKASDFFYADFDDWCTTLPGKIKAASSEEIVIVSNSLDPLLARQYNFDWIASLPADRKITLIIDDSHGFGITGKDGAGIYSQVKKSANFSLIVVSSFGKAMGIPGGIILSDAETIKRLKKSPYFNTSSPIVPAYLYAYLQSGKIYQQRRELLSANIQHFKKLIEHTCIFQHFENYPVFYTNQNKLYSFLMDKQILISSFAYPLPEDDLITRVVINSHHTPEDIDFLANCIMEYKSL